MMDIVEELESRAAQLNSQPDGPNRGDASLMLDAAKEIKSIRRLLGASSPGASYRDITKDLPRQEKHG